MKSSNLIPGITTGFELNYFTKKSQSPEWQIKNNESSQFENLFRLHQHDVTEILVFLDGECEFFCEGKSYSLRRGDVVVVPPYAVHQAIVKNFDNYERIILSVSEPLLDDFISSSPSMKENIVYQKTQGTYVLHLHSKNFTNVLTLVQAVTQRLAKGENPQSFSINYLVYQVLQDIFEPSSSMPSLSNKSVLDQRLVSILEYTQSHLTNPDLSLDHVAAYFHLNKYYFSHYFKNNMNLPFYRYVLLKRLSHAVTMIKENQMSIEKIAMKCGFSDYSSFYRLFKKEYNLSPKKMQKRM